MLSRAYLRRRDRQRAQGQIFRGRSQPLRLRHPSLQRLLPRLRSRRVRSRRSNSATPQQQEKFLQAAFVRGFFFVVFRAPIPAKAVSLEITNLMEGANVCRFAAGFRFDQPLASWLDDSDFLFHAGIAGRGGAHGSTSLYGRFAVAAPDAADGDWTTTIAGTAAEDRTFAWQTLRAEKPIRIGVDAAEGNHPPRPMFQSGLRRSLQLEAAQADRVVLAFLLES